MRRVPKYTGNESLMYALVVIEITLNNIMSMPATSDSTKDIINSIRMNVTKVIDKHLLNIVKDNDQKMNAHCVSQRIEEERLVEQMQELVINIIQ